MDRDGDSEKPWKKPWETAGKCGKIVKNVAKMWKTVGKCGKNVENCGKMWKTVETCGKYWDFINIKVDFWRTSQNGSENVWIPPANTGHVRS